MEVLRGSDFDRWQPRLILLEDHVSNLHKHPFLKSAKYRLYQVALPATHLRRFGRFVMTVQVFDLTHVYEAIMPAQGRVI